MALHASTMARYDWFVYQKTRDTSLKLDFTMRGAAMAQLPVFVAVAERRSFTAASRALGISPSAASQAIARLEQDLGAALLARTTRSVSLTDAGARLLAEVGPAMATASAALSQVRAARDQPAGVLRLSAPRVACRVGLPPLLAEYARRVPGVRTEVIVDDRQIDIVADGFDAGVRPRDAVHKDMVGLRISAPLRLVVVGSKRYLAVHGRPKHPRELVDHVCLGWRSSIDGSEPRWRFSERGRELEVAVRGPVLSNDVELLLACAERHLGLAFLAEAEAKRQIASGKLETVLDQYAVEVAGLFLYYPRAARSVPKLRELASCVRAMASAE